MMIDAFDELKITFDSNKNETQFLVSTLKYEEIGNMAIHVYFYYGYKLRRPNPNLGSCIDIEIWTGLKIWKLLHGTIRYLIFIVNKIW